MEWSIIAVVSAVVLFAIGVPVIFAFAFGLAILTVFAGVPMQGMMSWSYSQITTPVLLAIPLFILAGNLMNEAGIATHLLNLVNAVVGRIKGGLGVVTVVTCGFIGAITGSNITGVAAVGPILIPRMDEKGFPISYSTALLVSSSVLGLLIPPSNSMIVYGWVTETSILACFLSTVFPGIILIMLLSAINLIWVRRMPTMVVSRGATFKEFSEATWRAIPALGMPILILGGIYAGIFTPVEAASVSVIYAIPVGFLVYRQLTIKGLFSNVADTGTLVGAIMVMVFVALMMCQCFTLLRVPQDMAAVLLGVTTNKYLILLMVNVILIITGMLVSDFIGIVLMAPVLLPTVLAIGISPVQFAAIIGVNLGMGIITPPYCTILYFGMHLFKAPALATLKAAAVFASLAFLPVVLLTTYWSPLSLFLPKLLGFTV